MKEKIEEKVENKKREEKERKKNYKQNWKMDVLYYKQQLMIRVKNFIQNLLLKIFEN